MFVALKPLAERKHDRRPGDRAAARQARARSPARTCSCSRCRTSASAAGRATRSTSSRCRPTTSSELRDVGAAASCSALQHAAASSPTSTPTSRTRACRPRSSSTATPPSRLGVTPQMIDTTLNDAFGQRQVSTIYTQLNQYHVVMEVAPQYWQSPETLKDVYVSTPAGAQVPLSAFATLRARPTRRSAVNHQGQFVAVDDLVQPARRACRCRRRRARSSDAMARIGVPATRPRQLPGHARARSRPRSTSQPLADPRGAGHASTSCSACSTRATSIRSRSCRRCRRPASGALLALMLFKTEFTIIALIGVILLIGIVKKNAIMMIDFALDAERDAGHDARATRSSRPACCASGRS